MSRSLSILLNRSMAFLMAIYLFNFSIDSRDATPDYIAEDLSYNDIESVLEFSLECILGYQNAMAEHDERDQEGAGSFDFNKIFYCPSVSNVQLTQASVIRSIDFEFVPGNSFVSSFLEINSPPPRT
jgi:hypothetical protein